jgi:hypothetical protein
VNAQLDEWADRVLTDAYNQQIRKEFYQAAVKETPAAWLEGEE